MHTVKQDRRTRLLYHSLQRSMATASSGSQHSTALYLGFRVEGFQHSRLQHKTECEVDGKSGGSDPRACARLSDLDQRAAAYCWKTRQAAYPLWREHGCCRLERLRCVGLGGLCPFLFQGVGSTAPLLWREHHILQMGRLSADLVGRGGMGT